MIDKLVKKWKMYLFYNSYKYLQVSFVLILLN